MNAKMIDVGGPQVVTAVRNSTNSTLKKHTFVRWDEDAIGTQDVTNASTTPEQWAATVVGMLAKDLPAGEWGTAVCVGFIKDYKVVGSVKVSGSWVPAKKAAIKKGAGLEVKDGSGNAGFIPSANASLPKRIFIMEAKAVDASNLSGGSNGDENTYSKADIFVRCM